MNNDTPIRNLLNIEALKDRKIVKAHKYNIRYSGFDTDGYSSPFYKVIMNVFAACGCHKLCQSAKEFKITINKDVASITKPDIYYDECKYCGAEIHLHLSVWDKIKLWLMFVMYVITHPSKNNLKGLLPYKTKLAIEEKCEMEYMAYLAGSEPLFSNKTITVSEIVLSEKDAGDNGICKELSCERMRILAGIDEPSDAPLPIEELVKESAHLFKEDTKKWNKMLNEERKKSNI